MTEANASTNTVSIPGLTTIKATEISAPPAWALLERQLMNLMEGSCSADDKKVR